MYSVQCALYSGQCCAGVELSLGNNSRWPGSVLAGLGLDTGQYSPHIALHCQHCAICHTFIWYLSTISSHFTQYHFIVFFAHAHTERQTSFNSATSHILHILRNGEPSLQLRYDGVCSSARKWPCYHCYHHHHLTVCCRPGVRLQTIKQQSGVHHLIITPPPALSSAVSLVTVIKGWCHNSHNSHISHNTLVTNTPRLGRGCRLLTAEEERWPALMRTEQRPQEEGNYCSGGEAVSVSPSYPRGSPALYTPDPVPPGGTTHPPAAAGWCVAFPCAAWLA